MARNMLKPSIRKGLTGEIEMAYFNDTERFSRSRPVLTDFDATPFYMPTDKGRYITFREEPRKVRRLWRDYNAYKYYFNMRFVDFLRGEGVEAKITKLPVELRSIQSMDIPQN